MSSNSGFTQEVGKFGIGATGQKKAAKLQVLLKKIKTDNVKMSGCYN